MASEPVTEAQVKALAAKDVCWSPDCCGCDDYAPTLEDVSALATEVLAARARRCDACKHHDTSHVDMSGRLSCLRLGRLVAPDWHCAGWATKAPSGEETR